MPRSADASEPDLLDLAARERDKDEVDPELLGLPDPPRGERRTTVLLMAAAAIASAAMAFSLTRDATYALRSPTATDLGDLGVAQAGTFVSNGYVLGHGRLGGAGALRYERPFESDSYRIAPVAGRNDVWVELRVPAGEESNRYVPKTEFSGRMVRFSEAGLRHRGLRSAIEDRTQQKVPDGAFLVVDGQSPGGSRAFAFLWAMFVAFAVWNVVTIARLLRKVK
jgi:hypothetical protein